MKADAEADAKSTTPRAEVTKWDIKSRDDLARLLNALGDALEVNLEPTTTP